MIKLQTPVSDEKCKVSISFSNKITMLGSCFSDNIGSQLKNFGFDVMINPFGTLYNPISILQSIRRLVDGKHFTEDECVDMGAGSGLICSFSHHTSAARRSIEALSQSVFVKIPLTDIGVSVLCRRRCLSAGGFLLWLLLLFLL